ncbi:MAG: DNA phosphorothioation system sulfurtransferase DndC [Cyanobacteria bacterium]|jgi:DNA sulfur modification protein DndC|nr:DNA phosphorothioation system sulfurtransferase DndC [Cyanobacteria bacterium GSL.Bin1]
MNDQQLDILNKQRSASELVQEVNELTEQIKELYCQDDKPIVIGWSGGKDSTTVLQLFWKAVADLPVEKRKKTIYVISNDTLVENPIVSNWVRKSLKGMQEAADQQQMPIQTHLTYPAIQQRFWVCLIGKGYPAPRNRFRWCTDRMKIQPTDSFIREIIRNQGEVILVLGTRKAESVNRAQNMKKHRKWRVLDHLNANPSRPNSLIYVPIEDWQTNEVWMYLMQWENPWGGNNKDLLSMYQGATADNECPLVVDTSTPSCGDSRFGCWVCTMVSKDKSMEAMIQNDEEKEWMQPLLDIRNELDVENDHDRRDFRRIYGKVELFERNTGDGETSIKPIPGPYTKYWREYWLRRVLEAQVEVRKNAPAGMEDITLITEEELSEIRRIWLEEKHEFDDSLPRIYQEVTGEPFRDNRLGATNHVLGSDEWGVLEELCEDEMHLELMAKLLDTERQYHTKSRRSGIYQSLEKCFETSSRSKEEAIENAHLKRDLKTAVEDKDAEKVKQLTWANIKFSGQTPADDSQEN